MMHCEPLFALNTKRLADDVLRVEVIGDLDEDTAPMLRDVLTQAALQSPGRLEVDVGRATFFARAGLVELVAAQQLIDERIVLLNASKTVHRLLRVLGVEFALETT